MVIKGDKKHLGLKRNSIWNYNNSYKEIKYFLIMKFLENLGEAYRKGREEARDAVRLRALMERGRKWGFEEKREFEKIMKAHPNNKEKIKDYNFLEKSFNL